MTPGTGNAWTYTINPSSSGLNLTQSSHTITVIALDNAGNQTIQTESFIYTTTPPSLTYTNISASGGTVITSTTPSLTGNLTDVSGVASASYALQVWDPAAGTWNSSSKTWTSSGTWNTVSSGISLGSPANATSFTWSLNLSNLPDALYQIAITAGDVAGNSATSFYSSFMLSRANAGASVTAPALGTFQNGAFPLAGTASDPNGITSIQAAVASGLPAF